MAHLLRNDFIITSPYQSIPVPNCDLWTFIKSGLDRNENQTAMISTKENITLTFKDIAYRVELVAAGLINLGYTGETTFVLCLGNCIEFVITLLSVWKLGGSVALINQLLTAGEIKKFLEELNSDFILCDANTVEKISSLAKKTSLKKIVCTEEYTRCYTYSQFYNAHNEKNLSYNLKRHRRVIDPQNDVAVIPFSSGTTGKPKAVLLTHRAVIENVIVGFEAIGKELINNGAVIYQPFSHAYGLFYVIGLAYWGKPLVFMQKFDLEKYIYLISKFKIELLQFVPPTAVAFCKSKLMQRYDLSCVKAITCGAAALSLKVEDELRKVFDGRVKVVQGYGMTESVCGTVRSPPCNNIDMPIACSPGSVGWPQANTLVKVIDPKTKQNLEAYKEGEICIKCNYLMKGYLHNLAATTETIDEDGWLHTGDIGYYDKNCCLFVVDRIKELIKYKAYQVSPTELEGLILTHPAVADAAVTSVVDADAGELPAAWIVLKQGEKISQSDIVKFVNEKVAPFKKLRGGVKFVSHIPKSPSGKILRRLIRQTAIDVISKL